MSITAHRKHFTESDTDGSAKWLTTFNDLITLLMVFFVMLFAMGSLDVSRFQNFQNALQSAVGVLNPGENTPIGIISEEMNTPSRISPSDPSSTDEAAEFNQLENTQGLEAEYTKRGIQLTLNDELLFTSGSARLTGLGTALLEKVANIIGPLNRLVRVEGHTDNVPISTSRYPSNWELSTARAIEVVKYLQTYGKIAARNLSAAGYGASKPRGANDTEGGRSKNRRVEIILQQEAQSQYAQ